MRAFVLTDASLARYAGQFVWLGVNIDDSANSAFLTKYKVGALPMLLIIDPKTEAIALRYDGGPTLPQFKKLLSDGAGIVSGTRSAADDAIARGDQLMIAKRETEAVDAYEEAIAKAPKRWSRFGRAAESLVLALRDTKKYERCASRALQLYPQLAGTPSGVTVATGGLGCTHRLTNARADLSEPLSKAVRDELHNEKNSLSDADRADLYLTLIGEKRRGKDDAATKALREEAAAFMEKAAAEARTAEQHAALDFHRISVYVALGQPEKAVPMLEQSERDLPEDYNPPERLASIYRRMGKYDEALAASDRALARAHDAGKVMVLFRRADIYESKGDKAMAQQTLRDAIAISEALPQGVRSDETIAMMKKRLEKM